MLYITSSCMAYILITRSLYLWTTFTILPRTPSPASGNHQSVLCIYGLGLLFVLFSHRSGIHSSVSQFSRSVVSDSLQPNGLQHTRLPCPLQTPGAYTNSCPLSRWCHPTNLSLCCPITLPPSIFPSIRVFSNRLVLCIRWLKYWSFSFNISPSNEYSGFISFTIDWFDLIAV